MTPLFKGIGDAAVRVLADIRRDAIEAEQLRDQCFEADQKRRATELADLRARIERLESGHG